MKAKIVHIDRYGYNGRDFPPRETDLGRIVQIVSLDAWNCDGSMKLMDTEAPERELANGAFDIVRAITPGGRTIELVEHEFEVVLPLTNKRLFRIAHSAGITLYGDPKDYDNPNDDLRGGSGLIWGDDQHVAHVNLKDIPSEAYSDDTAPSEAYPFADDFEYQFFPSTGVGKDVAGDEVQSMTPDEDGNIYLYYPEQGIRIIHTRNDWI